MAAILDSFAARQEPIYVVGDFNIRLDRLDDPHADEFRLLVDCYRLVLHPTGPTHQLRGRLDAVISHATSGRPDGVAVEAVRLSYHFLLRWEVNTSRDPPSATIIRSHPWRHLDMELFRSALSTSQLCDPEVWPADIDEMATLYNKELDRLLSERQFVRRPRPSDPWFDKTCRDANVRLVGWNVRLLPQAVRLILPMPRPTSMLIQWRLPLPLPSSRLLLQRLHGTTSDARTVNFDSKVC